MENIIQSFTVMNKNLESKRVLNKADTSFEVYKEEFLRLSKTVDRPNDYYFENDLITFIIRLKNVGTKNIVGFTLKDDTPTKIDPMDNGYYEVLTSNGDVSFDTEHVIISNISLSPNEELEITITGVVKNLSDGYNDLDELF